MMQILCFRMVRYDVKLDQGAHSASHHPADHTQRFFLESKSPAVLQIYDICVVVYCAGDLEQYFIFKLVSVINHLFDLLVSE